MLLNPIAIPLPGNPSVLNIVENKLDNELGNRVVGLVLLVELVALVVLSGEGVV